MEVQAPVNGSEAFNNGQVNPNFNLQIGGQGSELVDVTQFFGLEDPKRTSRRLSR